MVGRGDLRKSYIRQRWGNGRDRWMITVKGEGGERAETKSRIGCYSRGSVRPPSTSRTWPVE